MTARSRSSDAFPASARLWQVAATALPSWRTLSPTVLYCARTLLAVAIALYVAFWLQLQSPSSAAITVLIVANPVNGALLSKSIWRLFGTIVGAATAVLLMAAFGQTPLLFFISFSLLIGAACIVSTLLRYFQAYGAVLAGYTIIIVCAPAFADPENVFPSAVSRLAAVSVGIASATLVFLLTSIRSPSRLSDATLSLVRSAGAALGGYVLPPATGSAWRQTGPGSLPPDIYDARGQLLSQANALGEIIEYAAADSYAVAERADALRHGAAGMMGALSSLHPFYPRLGPDDRVAGEIQNAIQALQEISAADPGPVLERLAEIRDHLRDRLDETQLALPDLTRLAAIRRVHDLLSRLHQAAACLIVPGRSRRARRTRPRLRQFLDWPTALRNGARGAIVTMLACLFWYVTQWPSGPTLLAYLVPAACLLASNPSASQASVAFATGTLLAVPSSYLCETLLLPQISGFPLLIGAFAICLLPGIWLQFSPRHGLRAFGYVVFFSAMITIRNPVSFDDPALINGWLAYLVGAASLVAVFHALLPADPARDSNRLSHALARAVQRLGHAGHLPDVTVWEYLRMQQVLRLIQRMQPMDASLGQRVIDCALMSIELGRDVLRLRVLLAGAVLEPPERDAARDCLRAISRLRRDPAAAGARIAAAATLLGAHPVPPPVLLHIAALLQEMAVLINESAGFLGKDFEVLDAG